MKQNLALCPGCRLALCLLCFALALPVALAQSAEPIVSRVALLGNEKGMELEITTSRPVQAQTQVLTGPDRIVVDFPGALPGVELKGFKVNHAELKTVRVGLFQANPPITRLVVDLGAPSQYQLFPSGNTVILKFGSSPAGTIVASIRNESSATAPAPPPPPPKVRVTYQDGLLSIHAQEATLAEVLSEIHVRTGADIGIPAGAEQEKVVVTAGPAPAKEVLAGLLNGSHFNFVMIGSAQNPNELRSLILTPKLPGTSALANTPPAQPNPDSDVPVLDPHAPPPPPQLITQPGLPDQTPAAAAPSPNPPPGQGVPADAPEPPF